MYERIGIIGSSGAIGNALALRLRHDNPKSEMHTFSSRKNGAISGAHHHIINYSNEDSIANAAQNAAKNGGFDLIIVATGILHDTAKNITPEKSLRDLSFDKFEKIFAANTVFPAIALKHFIPLLNKDKRSVFATLSARVGSISDNHIGGWYAYRASKAALNMLIKNAAIEVGRRHKDISIIALHPGTVDSDLSKPFQGGVKHDIFSPIHAARHLIKVINNVKPEDSGKCFAWDGQEIEP